MTAGNWIKWDKGLTRKREIVAISARLNLPRRIIACACMEFWEWTDSETTDGHLAGVTPLFVDELVALPGFAVALEEVDWLRSKDRGVTIPIWKRHNGESAKQRARNNRNQRQKRSLTPSVAINTPQLHGGRPLSPVCHRQTVTLAVTKR